MPKKSTSRKYPVTTPEDPKANVSRQYQSLQLEWTLELQSDAADWIHLFALHYKMAALERRAPWLKKEDVHEAR